MFVLQTCLFLFCQFNFRYNLSLSLDEIGCRFLISLSIHCKVFEFTLRLCEIYSLHFHKYFEKFLRTILVKIPVEICTFIIGFQLLQEISPIILNNCSVLQGKNQYVTQCTDNYLPVCDTMKTRSFSMFILERHACFITSELVKGLSLNSRS